MTIVEEFRAELTKIIDASGDKPLSSEQCYRSVLQQGMILCVPNSVASSFIRAIRILRIKSSNIGNPISDKALESILLDFLIELKSKPDQKEVKQEIDKHINGLFERLKNMRAKKFLFLVPIMNLNVAEEICIGDSSLFALNETTLGAIEQRFSVRFRVSEESLAKTIERFVNTNETNVAALVIVQASDTKKAIELALEKSESCLNALRLYGLNSTFVIREDFKKSIVRKLKIVNLDKKNYSESSHAINAVTNVPLLDSKMIQELKKGGFEILNSLLSKKTDELTPLQEDLLIAVMWLGNAAKDNQGNMKFVKAVMALETLLVPDGGTAKSNRIAKRFASIAYQLATDNEKKEVFLNVRSLYETRSSIIHAGEFLVHDEDLSQIMYWTTALIQILLPFAEKYSTLQELINTEFPVDESLYEGL